MVRKLVMLLVGVLAMPCAFATIKPEQTHNATLPPLGPHSFYIVDMDFMHMSESRVVALNGDRGFPKDYLAMVSAGFTPDLLVGPEGKRLYIADTYFNYGTRGKRRDYVTVVDTHTMRAVKEIPIPPKRQLAITMPQGVAFTNHFRFMLIFNVTPATSVTVVDLKHEKYLDTIPAAGCALIYGTRHGNRFSMLCGDGSILTVLLNDKGQAISRKHTKFFRPYKDFFFEKPAIMHGVTYFTTRQGMVHPVSFLNRVPKIEKPWSVVTPQEAEEHWKPGGWQSAAARPDDDLIYFAMHKGGAYTHEQPGSQIWVFNAKTHMRVRVIHAKTPVISMLVTRDSHPILAAVNENFNVDIYDADTGKYLRTLKNVGDTPFLLRHRRGS